MSDKLPGIQYALGLVETLLVGAGKGTYDIGSSLYHWQGGRLGALRDVQQHLEAEQRRLLQLQCAHEQIDAPSPEAAGKVGTCATCGASMEYRNGYWRIA